MKTIINNWRLTKINLLVKIMNLLMVDEIKFYGGRWIHGCRISLMDLKDQGQDIVKTIEQLADNPTVQLERLDEKRIMAYRGSRPFKNYRGRGRRRRDEDDVWFPNYEECSSSPERGRRDDDPSYRNERVERNHVNEYDPSQHHMRPVRQQYDNNFQNSGGYWGQFRPSKSNYRRPYYHSNRGARSDNSGFNGGASGVTTRSHATSAHKKKTEEAKDSVLAGSSQELSKNLLDSDTETIVDDTCFQEIEDEVPDKNTPTTSFSTETEEQKNPPKNVGAKVVEIYEELLKTSPKTTIKRRNSCFVPRSENDKNCDNLTKTHRKLVVHRSKSIDFSDIMCYTDFRVTRSKSHLYNTVGVLQEMYQTLGVTPRSRTKRAIKDDQKENVPKVQVNKKAKAKESSDVANKATPKQINSQRRKTIACLPTGNLPQDMPILEEVAVKSVKIGGKTVEKAEVVKSRGQSEKVAAKTNKQVNTPIASEKIIPCCSSEGKARPEKKEDHAKARVYKRKSAINGSQSNPKKQKESKEGKDAVGKLSLPITIPLSQPLNLSFSQPISVKSNSSNSSSVELPKHAVLQQTPAKILTTSCDLSTVSVKNSSDCVNLDYLMNEIFKEDDEASTTSSISLTYISETNLDECTTVTMEPEQPSKIVHQLANGATATYMSSSVANIASAPNTVNVATSVAKVAGPPVGVVDITARAAETTTNVAIKQTSNVAIKPTSNVAMTPTSIAAVQSSVAIKATNNVAIKATSSNVAMTATSISAAPTSVAAIETSVVTTSSNFYATPTNFAMTSTGVTSMRTAKIMQAATWRPSVPANVVSTVASTSTVNLPPVGERGTINYIPKQPRPSTSSSSLHGETSVGNNRTLNQVYDLPILKKSMSAIGTESRNLNRYQVVSMELAVENIGPSMVFFADLCDLYEKHKIQNEMMQNICYIRIYSIVIVMLEYLNSVSISEFQPATFIKHLHAFCNRVSARRHHTVYWLELLRKSFCYKPESWNIVPCFGHFMRMMDSLYLVITADRRYNSHFSKKLPKQKQLARIPHHSGRVVEPAKPSGSQQSVPVLSLEQYQQFLNQCMLYNYSVQITRQLLANNARIGSTPIQNSRMTVPNQQACNTVDCNCQMSQASYRQQAHSFQQPHFSEKPSIRPQIQVLPPAALNHMAVNAIQRPELVREPTPIAPPVVLDSFDKFAKTEFVEVDEDNKVGIKQQPIEPLFPKPTIVDLVDLDELFSEPLQAEDVSSIMAIKGDHCEVEKAEEDDDVIVVEDAPPRSFSNDSGISSPARPAPEICTNLNQRVCLCGRPANKICLTCLSAMYCSIACQHLDWDRHKDLCAYWHKTQNRKLEDL